MGPRPVKIKTEVFAGDAERAFAQLAALGRDPTDALDAVGRVLKTRVQLSFHSGTDPYGRPWAPLKSRSGKPLRDRGHLMNSYDYRVEGATVVIGTNLAYAPVHQFGATIKPKSGDPKARLRFLVNGVPVFVKEVNIPPREMLPLSGLPQDWSDDVTAAISDVITRKWAA